MNRFGEHMESHAAKSTATPSDTDLLLALAQGAIHDINNQLMLMICQAKRIVANEEAGHDRAQRIMEAGDIAAQIAQQVLINPNQANEQRACVLDFIIKSAIRNRSEAESYQGRLCYAAQSPALRAAIPSIQLLQSLDNLIDNAQRACPDCDITIRLYQEEGRGHESLAVIEICDSGPGIDPEYMEQVFEPYVSFREGGAGLGLAMVREQITNAGGSIEIANRDTGGLQVRMYLPLCDV